MAQSGHATVGRQCPLLGVKRTLGLAAEQPLSLESESKRRA
jgi:hypothetical protein